MFDPAPFPQISKNKLPTFISKQKTALLQHIPIVLRFLKQFGIFKSRDKGSYGSKNPEIVKMLGFGSPIMKSTIYKLKLK